MPENTETEQLIIETARQIFIEKGYAETSMSDIAARVGMNRPALHYYFRTKDRMFEAVFADIVHSFLPSIHEAVTHEAPLEERIRRVVDIYCDALLHNPFLPMFALREIHRDPQHLLDTAQRIEAGLYIGKIRDTLIQAMEQGEIRQMPIQHIFYTFYGLMLAPFLSRPIAAMVFPEVAANFEQSLAEWKPGIVEQMTALLQVRG